MRSRIDLNCDMGESFGAWQMGDDDAILPHVSSVNVACGFHAGDPGVMRRTVDAALRHGIAVGAHPSLPDLQGFGRRAMQVSADQAYELVLYQIGALAAFCAARGAKLSHVKAHGALYNMAARDAELAQAIARAVRDFDASAVLVGLSGSELVRAGRALGLAVAAEAFADRTYQADGSLTPRSDPNALIHDVEGALGQVERMVTTDRVETVGGGEITIEADTICIHGDAPGALDFARRIRLRLEQLGIAVRALRDP
jgi:UPF0271 protein